MRLEIDFSDRAEVIVYFHEDTEPLKDLQNESAALPELKDLNPKAGRTTTDIDEPEVMTEVMGVQTRVILMKYHDSFLGDGNVVPSPARRMIYDLNVNDANGVAQRSRPIRLELVRKVYDLLEQRFQTELIEYSHSEWASPIVIVMKKIGVDIGICIGHLIVSQLTKLLHYPQPLIDDLLFGFKGFLSLGMAKKFWTVPMTLRAKHISAFICLLGYFQRKRRLLGLKKAPLIYLLMLDDCLWGFVCLPASEESQVDANGLAFLGISVGDSAQVDTLIEGMAGFPRNVPASPQLKLVREESSYIDDIGYGAETWKQLCVDLDRLLYRLRCWVTSMSLLKNELGKKMISCLSHEIEADRIQAQPTIAKGVKNIPSPSTLKGVQSLPASLNYCNGFINSLQVIAAMLNKTTDVQIRSGRDLGRAMEALGILKHKIVSTSLLRHQDSQKSFVIIIHANPWTACAVLGQESDGVIFPVHIAERVLRGHELRYHLAENEVVALIRALRVFRTMLAGTKLIKVYTQYSLLEWISTSR
ncbi:hypothetical protein PR003_g22592 [Phytophthora rubi]|uniref:Reverse transcriptase RNase H-like domain-containing protein n=1 Tax=Phytophthora rubi TaxID=129364 RepID=A0A6A3JKT6_9STRA|nr:hypothetical protein PR001_g20968 [Phytophthora rubi]KAE9301157.1 hypothetical protein PR003_g22592 [Phytophthora rubi]